MIAAPQRLQPIQSTGASSKSIFVSDLAVALVNRKIGQMKGGLLCVGGVDLVWMENQSVLNAMRQQAVNTFSKYGYNVYSGLIQSRGQRESDILIGIGVDDIKANLCSSIEGAKGAASLRLKWEVLDTKTNKAVSLTTEGAATITEFSPTGDPDVFVRAVEMATENLLAQGALAAITRKPQ